MMQLHISEEAVQDLNEGFLFYEAQEAGLGDYFVSSLRSDIERLKFSAMVHRVIYKDYYRLLSRVFPFGIFYTVEESTVIIWAVVDLRRDPDWIREKLSSSI